MADYILKNWDGNVFISMANEDENTLSQYEQLTQNIAVFMELPLKIRVLKKSMNSLTTVMR